MRKYILLVVALMFCSVGNAQMWNGWDDGSPQFINNGKGSYTLSSANTVTAMTLSGSSTLYYQMLVSNSSTINGASADVVVQANNGTEASYYVDMGINNANGGGAPFTKGDDGYVYSSDTTLNIGAFGSGANVVIATGANIAGATTRMTVSNTGTVTIPNVKATTGNRMLCVDSAGLIFSVNSAVTCGAGT